MNVCCCDWFKKVTGQKLGRKRLCGRPRLEGHWEEEWVLRSPKRDAEEAGDKHAMLKEGTTMWQKTDKKYGLNCKS